MLPTFYFCKILIEKTIFIIFLMKLQSFCLYPLGVDSAPDSDTPYVSESDDKELDISSQSLYNNCCIFAIFITVYVTVIKSVRVFNEVEAPHISLL